MRREELLAAQRAELAEMTQVQIDDLRRAARGVRERIDVNARAIARQLPEAARPKELMQALYPIDPISPIQEIPDEGLPEIEPVDPVDPVSPVDPLPGEASAQVVDFGEIAANIANIAFDDDWNHR